ncbi:MAG: tetratricopeptide repeat protein, partial [Actinobacteria bacterium]|nr:tetratricopeptide repeat protein [Actinomycetota bacterium]
MIAAGQLQYAIALHRAGQLKEATSIYRTLIKAQPKDADLHHLIALALANTEPATARTELRRALALAPTVGLYLHNAAHLSGDGNPTGHSHLLVRALAVDPHNAIAHHRLGALHARAGRTKSAARHFRLALALEPTLQQALYDHANLAADTKRMDVAYLSYIHLLTVDPTHHDGLITLGALLFKHSRWSEAEAIFLRLVGFAPDNSVARTALGKVRIELGNTAGAIADLHTTLILAPASSDAWHALSCALLKEPATSQETLRTAERASVITPTATAPHVTRSLALFHQGRIREAIAARRAILKIDPSDSQAHYEFLPFLHLDPDLSPEDQLSYRRNVHRRFSNPLHPHTPTYSNYPDPDRRLKVGYIDNRMLGRSTHSTNLLPTIEAHDPTAVALYFYTNLPTGSADDMTCRYAATATCFRHTGELSDADVSDLVRNDRIDILIDVSSHLTGTRVGVFARKPAPIQITMLQVGSSGLKTMDYAIADATLLPLEHPTFFTEEIIRLPVGFLFEPVADLTPPIAPRPSHRPITFGSLNLLAKVNDKVIALWARVLLATPGSRLLLKATGLACSATRARIAGVFAGHGIDPARLEFRAWTQGYAGHLSTFDEIDIALDCFPYPGMTTSLEALLMGVPV